MHPDPEEAVAKEVGSGSGEGLREGHIGSGGRRIRPEAVHIPHEEAETGESHSRHEEEEHRSHQEQASRIQAAEESRHTRRGEEELRSRLEGRHIPAEAEEGRRILLVHHSRRRRRRRRNLHRILAAEDRWEEDSCYRIRSLHLRAGRRRAGLGQGNMTWLGSIESEAVEERETRGKERRRKDATALPVAAGGDGCWLLEGRGWKWQPQVRFSLVETSM